MESSQRTKYNNCVVFENCLQQKRFEYYSCFQLGFDLIGLNRDFWSIKVLLNKMYLLSIFDQ